MIQTALWTIVGLLVLQLIEQNQAHQALEELLRKLLEPIQSAAERWERNWRAENEFVPEPKVTTAILQKREEDQQELRRRQVELNCGGWRTARILCRRNVEPLMPEYVLGTANGTYTVHGRMES